MAESANLAKYFENNKGLGVLSTASADGAVDSAIYARPHVIDDTTVAFVMRHRQTHANLQSNPRACYLFVQQGPGYVGRRLHLTLLREEKDHALVETMRRRRKTHVEDADPASVVYFRIDQIRPLVGDEEA